MKKEKIKMPDLHNVREKGENQISRTMEKARSFKIGKSGFYLKFRNMGFSINPETGYGTDMIPGYPLCTGPPGRARSPGDRGHPEHPPDFDQISKVPGSDIPEHSEFVSEMNKDPVRNKDKIGNQKSDDHTVWFIRKRLDEFMKNRINTEYQIINRYKLNFLQTLISRIMKKQILFLAMFTLALILAGTSTVFGQALAPSTFGTKPIPLTLCVGDPQHPKASISYTYELDPTGSVIAPTTYTFWATKDPNFVSGAGNTVTNQTDSLRKAVPAELLNYSANYKTAGATNSVDITWSPEILSGTDYQATSPTFVVGLASDGCTDNIKVWEIDPSPSFTVDITNIDPATELALAYAAATTQCVDNTRAAKYNATSFGVDYDYGADTLYYEVIASNFVTSWKPTFFLAGLDAGAIQTAEIHFASSYANATAGTYIETGDITSGTYAGTTDFTSTVANTTDGVSLIVKVVVSNHNYETLAQQSYTLSVAGEDADGFDIVDDATCTVPADAATAATDDFVTRTIDPRPTLIEGTTILLTNDGTVAP